MELERRENPSNYYWEGTLSSDAQDPGNWATDSGYEPLPGPDDVVIFEGIEQYDADLGYLGIYSAPCTNFKGDFGGMIMYSGYNSTVTLSGAVKTDELFMNTGTIDQPISGTDITIEMGFNWEDGGTLNSTSNLATVHFLGGCSAFFTPDSASLNSGSTLCFEGSMLGSSTAEFGSGSLQLNNGAGIIVDGGGDIVLSGITLNCVAPIGGGDAGIFHNKHGRIINGTTDNKFTGKQFINESFVEINDLTTFEIDAGGVGTPAYIQPASATGAETILETGTRLKAQAGVTIESGLLKTKHNEDVTENYYITTDLLTVSGAKTVVDLTDTDPVYNAPNLLLVSGSINWQGGTFRTRINGGTAVGDRWAGSGKFTINGKGVSFDLVNIGGEPVSGASWDVIRGGEGIVVQNGLPTLVNPYTLVADPMDPKVLEIKVA